MSRRPPPRRRVPEKKVGPDLAPITLKIIERFDAVRTDKWRPGMSQHDAGSLACSVLLVAGSLDDDLRAHLVGRSGRSRTG